MSRKFLAGKVPVEILQDIVFKHLGVKRRDVILGPAIGEDAAILKVGEEVLVVATDPITGAEERVGWLAVNVSANDVATCGVQPRWFTSCILLPKGSKRELIEDICEQIDKAARQLDMAVIAGHCEFTPGLDHPVVIGCSIGVAEEGRYVTSSGAKPGETIILTKGAGIEGTAILASDRKDLLIKEIDEKLIEEAERFFEKISVVKDAIIAFRIGGVTAMHDPTEGGVAGGVHELADASKVGFQIYEDKILISEATRKICAFFKIDPLQLISSGSLLIVAKRRKVEDVLKGLIKEGIDASIIGETREAEEGRFIITRTGRRRLARPTTDHLWFALGVA